MASQLRLRRSISTLTFSSKQPARRWTLLTWIPLLVLHSPSRTTSTASLLVLGSLTIAHPRPQTSSRGFCFPSDVPRARSPLPRKLSSPRLASATANSLRRGIPSPLRFAYTVFHGPDDLLLLAPCGIFQPLTPVGFFRPFSRSPSRDHWKEAHTYHHQETNPRSRTLGEPRSPLQTGGGYLSKKLPGDCGSALLNSDQTSSSLDTECSIKPTKGGLSITSSDQRPHCSGPSVASHHSRRSNR